MLAAIGLLAFVRWLHPATVSFGMYCLALLLFGVLVLMTVPYER